MTFPSGATPEIESYLGALLCPECRDEYLRHEAAEAFWREDDAEEGLRVTSSLEGAAVETRSSMDACPSARRSGLRIVFRCEHCEGVKTLAIVQHKGCTYLSWEP